MKFNYIKTFIISVIILISGKSFSQQQLEIDLNQAGVISADIETLLDNVLIQVRNLTPDPVATHFVASIIGTDSEGTRIRIDNFFSEFHEVIIEPGGENFTIRRLVEEYQGTTLEDYNFVPEDRRDQIIQSRRLPEGQYQICLEARSYPFGELISEPMVQSCFLFEIQYLDPPIITSPDHNALVTGNPLDEVIVYWNMAQARAGTTFLLEMVRFDSRAQAEIFESQGRPDDIFDALPRLLEQDEINSYSYSTLQNDSPLDLEPRDIIGVRVTAINPNLFIRQEGRSRIVIFHYGVDESMACRLPNVTGEIVFPLPGDTIPYSRIYSVAKILPDCDNYTEIDLRFNFSSDRGSNLMNISQGYDYTVSGSPRQFLTDFINNSGSTYRSRMDYYYPDGSDRHLDFLLYDNGPTMFQVERGDEFAIIGRADVSFNSDLAGTLLTRSVSFNEFAGNMGICGMPKPRLSYPEEGLDIAPGVVGFGFDTGMQPVKLVPPYKMYTVQPGQPPTVLQLRIIEKCVLQIAKNREFTPESIIYSQVKKIQANIMNSEDNFNEDNPEIEAFSPVYDTAPEMSIDESAFVEKVYRDFSTTASIGENGEYFWRVVWLKDPTMVNVVNPHLENIEITPDMIYHASQTRRFTISPDGVSGTGGTESEESAEPNDCERICNFTPVPESQRANIRNVNNGQTIMAGPLQIRVTSITNNDSGHTGTGVLILPSPTLGEIKIRVRFNNIGINANYKLISGTITAETNNTSSRPTDDDEERAAVVDAISWLTRFAEATTDDGTSLPLGLDVTDNDELRIVCAIDQISITPSGARATYLAGVKLPEDLNAPALLFKAENVCFNPEGMTSAGKYMLAESIEAELDNGWTLGINGGSGAGNSTYIEFDCDGFKEFAFRGKVTFSRDAIVPENEETGEIVEGDDKKVSAIFGTIITKPRPAGSAPPSTGASSSEPRSENFIIDITFDKPFQITALSGVGFTITSAVLDLSEVSNHSSMEFLDDYDLAYYGERSNMSTLSGDRLRNAWTGFFLKTLDLRLPKEISGSRTGIGIRNMLIDNSGLTVSVRAASGWAELRDSEEGYLLSLDAFSVGVVQSRSVFFSLEGKIGLPVFREEDYLRYSAALVMGGPAPEGSDPGAVAANLVFNIRVPSGRKLLIPMWDIANIELDPATNVELSLGTTTRFSFGITGSVSFQSENNEERESDDITIDVPHLRLENLRFSTSESGLKGSIVLVNGDSRTNLWSHTGEGDSGDSSSEREERSSERSGRGSGSGESDQSSTAGFPINLEGISLGLSEGTDISDMTYDIRFMLSLSFSDQIRAAGDLGFRFKLGDSGKFNQFTLQEFLPPTTIEVEAKDLGGIELMGRVSFCNQGLNERFIGALKVKVPSLGEINLYADFGTKRDNTTAAFNTEEYFSFFAIEGSVILSTGITLFPGVALYGLGGGVFYRMARNDNPSLTMPPTSTKPGERPADADADDFPEPVALGCNNAPYRPDFNTFMGFKFKAYLGDNGGGSAYNLDIMIQAMLEGNDRGEVVGISSVNFEGNLYVATNIGTGSDEAPLRARVNIDYTRSRDGETYYEGIHGVIQVYLNLAGVLTGSGPDNKMVDAVFHADNRDMWYFFLGAPAGIRKRPFKVDGREGSAMANYPGPAGIKILDALSVNTYFMIGKSIPDIPPIDSEIEAIMAKSKGFDDRLTALPVDPTRPSDMESGDGFAHGLNFRVDNTFNFLLFYAKMKVILGYDINFRYYEGSTCLRSDGEVRPLGINGWFAKGQAYAGLEGEFGIGVDFGFFSAKVPIVELGCAVTMQAEFPNPEWFKARAGLYYTILNGAIEGRANFVFEIGEKCYDPNYSPLDALDFISEVLPEGSSGTFARPTVSFVLPMNKELKLEDDQYSGPDSDRPVYRYFIPQFRDMEVRKVSRDTLIPLLPDIDEFNGGYSLRQYFVDELEGHTEYKIKATVIAFERIPGRSGLVQVLKPGGEPWTNSKEVTFRTGSVQEMITLDNLISTYPFIGQRNFMPGENGQFGSERNGWIDLQSGARCLVPSGVQTNTISKRVGTNTVSRSVTTSTSYELELTPSDNANPEAGVLKVPVQYLSNRSLSYNIPADLINGQIYRARLIKRVSKTEVGGASPFMTARKETIRTVTRSSGTETSSAEIKGYRIGTSSDDGLGLFDKELLEFYFRTSIYSNLREKFADMTQNPVSKVWGAQIISFTGAEPFDKFDKNGYLAPYNSSRVFKSLVEFIEPYTDPTLSRAKNGVYKFSEDLGNTVWTHTFLNDPMNPDYDHDLNQMMINRFRIEPEPGQFIYTNEYVRVAYRSFYRWTVPGQLPQAIQLGDVLEELNGFETTFRRTSGIAAAVTSVTSAPGSSYLPTGGIISHFGTSGSSSASRRITIINANPWEWLIDHNRLKNKTTAISGRFESLVHSFEQSGSMPVRINRNWNYWFNVRTSPSPLMSGTTLLGTKFSQRPDYTGNTSYQLEVGYNRPKTSVVNRIPNIRWTASN